MSPETIGLSADIIGIIGAVFATFAWWQARETNRQLSLERQRLNQLIGVRLVHVSGVIEVPAKIRRADLARAEVLGRIGMIPLKSDGDDKQPRFKIDYLNTPLFFEQLDQLVKGKGVGDVLTIRLTESELERFDL